MASITVACHQCGQIHHSDPAHRGKLLRCSRCGARTPIIEQPTALVQVNSENLVRPVVRMSIGRGTKSVRKPWIAVAIVLIGALLVWHYFPILKGDSDAREGQPSFNDIDGFVAQERGPQEPVSKGLNPGPGPDLYRSLPTGTEFCKAASEKGSGLLKIDNGTSEDAALRIFDSNTGKTIRCLFVKSHDTTRVKSIPPGQYALRYTSGMDWQGEEQAFRVNPSYNEFERELDYSETHRGNETEYHEIRVTLHPVLNGNVKIHSISRDQFLGR